MHRLCAGGYWGLIALLAICALAGEPSTAQHSRERVLFSGPASATDDLAFTADGKTLVLGSRVGTLKIWDMALGRERAASTVDPALASGSLAVTPDGSTLAWADERGQNVLL